MEEATTNQLSCIILTQQARSTTQKQKPGWNYKKANWGQFQKLLEDHCRKQDFIDQNLGGRGGSIGRSLYNIDYLFFIKQRVNEKDQNLSQKMELFSEAVLDAAKKVIPRGRCFKYKPGWDDHLQRLHDTLSNAREVMENNPTNENVTAHNKARADYNKAKLEQLCISWHEKTQSLNMEKDNLKLWQLTRTLNNDITERRQTVLEIEGEFQTGKKG